MVHRPDQHKHIAYPSCWSNWKKTLKQVKFLCLYICGYELESRLGYCDSIFVNTLKRYGFDPIWGLKSTGVTLTFNQWCTDSRRQALREALGTACCWNTDLKETLNILLCIQFQTKREIGYVVIGDETLNEA